MLAAIIVIVQWVRSNDRSVNLQNLLDIIGLVADFPQLRYVFRRNLLLNRL